MEHFHGVYVETLQIVKLKIYYNIFLLHTLFNASEVYMDSFHKDMNKEFQVHHFVTISVTIILGEKLAFQTSLKSII